MVCASVDEMNELSFKAPLRTYQKRIIKEVTGKNALVVLPTGSGKTRIAAEVTLRFMSTRKNVKILFLAPTCILAKQQAKMLEVITKRNVSILFVACFLPHNAWLSGCHFYWWILGSVKILSYFSCHTCSLSWFADFKS